jgi:solute carrier family 35 protein F5
VPSDSSSFSSFIARSNIAGRWTLGLIILLGVVFIWVFSGVLMQYIFTNADFDHPFFLTFFSTSLFTLHLLDFLRDLPWRRACGTEKDVRREFLIVHDGVDAESGGKSLAQGSVNGSDASVLDGGKANGTRATPSGTGDAEEGKMYTFWQIARTSLIFCPIWFAANYSYNKSLSLTSVSSNTILSSTSGLGTLFLGSLLGVDSFSFGKLIAVALSLGGVAMVALTDSSSTDGDSLVGDILSLVGAAFYALYVVLLKLLIKDETKLNTRRFFGLVGLFNVVMLWPLGFLLNYIGIEEFALPPSGAVWLYLTVNGLIGTVLSDYLWLWSVLLTSPLVATIGLSLTIPFAMLADIVIKGKSFDWLYLLGSASVIAGFLLVNCDDLYLRLQRRVCLWLQCQPRSPTVLGDPRNA